MEKTFLTALVGYAHTYARKKAEKGGKKDGFLFGVEMQNEA